jgi:hypothetical protein
VLPFDIVKSRAQVASIAGGTFAPGRRSVPADIVHIVRTEGIRGLYKGWSAAAMRAFPANGALFWGVSFAESLWEKHMPTAV